MMGATLDKKRLQATLEKAVRLADRDEDLPAEWTDRTEHIGDSPSKTYVAVLASALLARAAYGADIDPRSIKRRSGARGFSARGSIRVLASNARDFGYDLGVSGPEPLNNQPWFHVDRVDQIRSEEVRADARDYLRAIKKYLKEVDELSGEEALRGLAALISTRRNVAERKRGAAERRLREQAIGIAQLAATSSSFIAEDPEGGRRGQALVAAALDCAFPRVELGAINDPDAFDVVAFGAKHDDIPALAVQVKQKPVGDDAAIRLAEAATHSGVPAALLVALAPDQPALDDQGISAQVEGSGVIVWTATRVERLLAALAVFSTQHPEQIAAAFPQAFAKRLTEIDVRDSTVSQLETLLAELERE